MKKIIPIVVIVIALLLQGCAIMPLYGVPQFFSYNEAFAWIDENISYARDNGEQWATPNTTVQRGYGDCEDKALLALDIIAQQFGEEGDLVIVRNPNTGSHHAYADFAEYEYFSIPGCVEVIRYSYRTAMAMAKVI